jgi:hypothetical protein
MDFNGYLNELKGLLKAKYHTIDFDGGDFDVDNKLGALALVVSKRINYPAPQREVVTKEADGFSERCRFK